MTTFSEIISLVSLRKDQTDESAFTLFELLVVCALISVMLVVAAPTLRNNLLTNPLKASSRQVIGIIKGIREQAVREQQAYFIHFDFSENSIWVEKDAKNELDEPEKEEKVILLLPEPARFLDVWTTSEGKKERDQTTLWISKQGYMDQTMVHLGNDGDEVMSLLFSPFLGPVRISDSYVNLD